MKPPTSGDQVTLIGLPATLLRGLPAEDQTAIDAVVGYPVIFIGWCNDGKAEVEFRGRDGALHTIWVNAEYIRDA